MNGEPQALILAGGRGTRLHPYTVNFPKPLMPIGEEPVLEVVIRQLARDGFRRIAIATNHLASMIQLFFADGAKWGVEIEYLAENEPLGTAGAISLLGKRVSGDLLVLNGDILTTMSFARGLEFHRRSGAAATVSIFPREVQIDFGVIESNAAGGFARYVEKPAIHYDVSMGINFFGPPVWSYLEPGKRLDIPELITRMAAAGESVACYRPGGYWLDIGRPEDYAIATSEFAGRRSDFLNNG